MKKITLLLISAFIFSIGNAQDVRKSTSGEISFFSETPVEDIDAVNKKVRGIIKPKTSDVAFVATIVGFHFEKPLMEEHFNENYMESDQYKVATFKGKIVGDVNYQKDGEYAVKAKGVLNIHGVDKDREIMGTITVKDGTMNLNSTFNVALKDHDIKIPKLVVKNIAETVRVTVNIDFLQTK